MFSKVKALLKEAEDAVERVAKTVSGKLKGQTKDDRQILRLPIIGDLFRNIPAIPVDILETLQTLVKIQGRMVATQQAKQGLTAMYKIGARTETAYTYMYGDSADTPTLEYAALHARLAASDNVLQTLVSVMKEEPQEVAIGAVPLPTQLSLDSPEQFAMTWTTFTDIAKDASPQLGKWTATLTDADQATKLFWPTIAEYGMAYDLLILKKIGPAQQAEASNYFGVTWTPELTKLSNDGLLYGLDLRIFASIETQEAEGLPRFTPSTWTLLKQDPATKALTPIVISVTKHEGAGRQDFVLGQAKPSAWIYALFAAKTSVTVYGIWLGHVYQWHLVTAAMQMTMYNSFSIGHPIYMLLKPQSNYLFGFDTGLLSLWSAAGPPTSITSSLQFLSLCNTFGENRSFFADDPRIAIANLGLDPADFTVAAGGGQPWNCYPLVGQLLEICNATEKYVTTFVNTFFPTDASVQNDADLQAWITASSDTAGGNIQGLPRMDTREALTKVLTSYLYRITVHGCSRQMQTSRKVLSFVPNFPPCLQNDRIPSPNVDFSLSDLLKTLPVTGTLGTMMTFYYTFAFSAPYEPLIPLAGVDRNLFFPGGPATPCNLALVDFRKSLIKFIGSYDPESPQISQWPLNIET